MLKILDFISLGSHSLAKLTTRAGLAVMLWASFMPTYLDAQGAGVNLGSRQLSLKVKYIGDSPAFEVLENPADKEICGDTIKRKLIPTGSNGGLQDVVAALFPLGNPKLRELKVATDDLPIEVLNIKNCEFNRRILLLRPHQTLRIYSEDPINFDLFFAAKANHPFSLSLPPNLQFRSVSFKKTETIELKGGIHESLSSYLVIRDNPWVALGNEAGEVKINGIPKGSYQLQLWHPFLGTRMYSSPLEFGNQDISLEIALRDGKEK